MSCFEITKITNKLKEIKKNYRFLNKKLSLLSKINNYLKIIINWIIDLIKKISEKIVIIHVYRDFLLVDEIDHILFVPSLLSLL